MDAGAPPRRQQRKRAHGESASRGRGSAIETIEESEPSHAEGDNAITPASRGPSVQVRAQQGRTSIANWACIISCYICTD